MYILYLEDEPNDAVLVDRFVRTKNYRLATVSTIDEAQATLSEWPDMVFVDVMLNRVREGNAFVRYLRQQGYLKPIIAITGLTLYVDIQECFDAGCDAVLTKPFAITQLAEMINRFST